MASHRDALRSPHRSRGAALVRSAVRSAFPGGTVIGELAFERARPLGTENIYKIYAESFHGRAHLETIFLVATRAVILGADVR